MQILVTLGLAFLGGLILNIMPCVLPVLTLKAFTVVEYAQEDPAHQRKHGLAYALGTVTALMALGAVVLAVRASGKLLGWGMQFQYPGFVAVLTAIVVAFGLNALGVFEINVGASQEERAGVWGSVANGWFAAIMATPCSAPFLGPAAAFAVASDTPGWLTLLVFGVVGFGLAFPFVALTFVPSIGKRLPKPGRWMETFKKLMGFSLLGTGVWLYGVLARQLTPEAATRYLAFLVLMGLVLWAVEHFGGLSETTLRRWGVRLVALGALAGAGFLLNFERRAEGAQVAAADGDVVVKDGKINWAPFDPKRIEADLAAGRPVFLDYTADWCASCKANDKLFVDTAPVRSALERSQIVPVKVDMTNEDDVKDAWLKKVGRNALPVYVVLLPGGGMDLLPVAITSETLVDALDRASKKHPPRRARVQ